MFCCVCAGSCNHVGNHSYCSAHGGQPALSPPTWTWTSTNTYLPSLSDADVERIAQRVVELLQADKLVKKRRKA